MAYSSSSHHVTAMRCGSRKRRPTAACKQPAPRLVSKVDPHDPIGRLKRMTQAKKERTNDCYATLWLYEVSDGEEELRATRKPSSNPPGSRLHHGDSKGNGLILIAPATAQWSVRIEAYAAATKGNVRLPPH